MASHGLQATDVTTLYCRFSQKWLRLAKCKNLTCTSHGCGFKPDASYQPQNNEPGIKTLLICWWRTHIMGLQQEQNYLG